MNEQNNNKKLLRKEIEKGSSPIPPPSHKETNGTTLERGVCVWVKQGIGGEDPPPQLLRGMAQSSRDQAGRDRGGSLEVGSPSLGRAPASAGRAPHMGEEAHSGVSSMSKVSDSAGRHSRGLQGPCVATARTPPRVPRPARLTKLPSCVGLCALAAVAKLHERVQGARGHGQVDGVAEGGAVQGRKGKAEKPPESGPGQSSLTPPLPPTGPRPSQELSGGKGPREGRDGAAVRAASGPWLSTDSLPLPRTVGAVVGWKPLSSETEHTQSPPSLTDTPRNTYGVTQMNLVFRYGAAPAEEGAASSADAGGGTLLSSPQSTALRPPSRPQRGPRCPPGTGTGPPVW